MNTKPLSYCLPVLVALLLAAASAVAQTNPPAPPAPPAVPPGPIIVPGDARLTPEELKARIEERRTASSNPVNAVDAAVVSITGTNDLAAEIAKLKFERTPEALLQAVKSQQADAALSAAESFRIAVLLGDWTAVGATLRKLPPRDATRAYTRLLEALAGASQSVADFYRQTPRGGSPGMLEEDGEPSARSGSAAKASPLLSADFYALLDAAPADLTAAQIPPLAALVKIAIGNAGKKDFLVRLETGMRGFGGPTPEGRKLAAQLLSALDWIADAGPYLPLERAQWDQAETLQLVLTLEHFTQTGIQKRDERQLRRAAEVCAFMMQTSRFGDGERGLFRQATDRFVKLLPALEPADAEQLLREYFLTQPTILNDLLLALGESGQQAQRNQTDLNLRGQSLATQNLLLRVLAARKSAPPESVNLLVMNWLTEAETTYRSGEARPEEEDLDNPFIYRPPSYYARRRNQPKVVPPEIILTNAPPAALIRRLNDGLAQRVKLTRLKVNLMDPKEPMTLETLAAYLKEHPGYERELCQDYLAAWVKKRSVPPEDPNITRMRNLGYVISRQQQSAGGIPLTRLRQNKNVADYRELLAALRALSPEPLPPGAIVQGFMAIHSGAEVYRAADIEAIFGPPEKMNRAELLQLLTGMRTKLREQWRDPQTQQQAGTNRTEEEAKDEVSRGYRTALELARRGLTEENADWPQFIVRGQLFFDASEFEFARQVKLTEYVSLRDEAFASYRRAAQIYGARVPELARGQWTLEPYQMWFFVMLGASDLSQLTRAAARSDPGLSQIGDAMRALPGEAAEGHLRKFGEMLGTLLSQVPGNMRQRFLSAGLQVVGADHPSAAIAQAALKNYEELLDEVALRVTLDGPARVGHRQPFGVVVSLEHTRQLARESGGFGKYLQNATAQRPGGLVNPNLAAQANYRDNFRKNIHAALEETFEIVGITFHDATVRPIDLPREGWQSTPLAYLLLRAKEAAVDRLPSIQLDMDFSDTSGQVVLPVRSQVEPLDAKDPEAPARPCADLALTFSMDERDWRRDGRVVVEVSAKAMGVIPPHTQLFDFEQAGFTVEVTDNGLSINEFVSDGKTTQARADRNWQFTYQRQKDARGAAVLQFPAVKPGIPVASAEYQHYQDADLLKLEPAAAAAGIRLHTATSRTLQIAGWLGGLLLVAAAVWFWRRSQKRHAAQATETLALPAELTPFSVVAFLRRLHHERAEQLDDATREKLRAEIAAIEAAYFRAATPAPTAPDVSSIARRWWEWAR